MHIWNLPIVFKQEKWLITLSRNTIVVTAVLFLLTLSSCSKEKEAKLFTVGVINFSSAAEPAYHGFKAEMAIHGFFEGQNVRYLYKGAIKNKKKLAEEGKRLVDAKVDLIFSMTTPAALAAKEATKNLGIPVVFSPVSNPVRAGLVNSLRQPGGNITGVTFLHQEPKRLEYFKKVAANIHKVAFPYNPDDPSPTENLKQLSEISKSLGLELIPFKIEDNLKVDQFLSNIPDEVDSIYIPTDSLLASRIKDFVKVSIEKKLPLTTPQQEGVKAGALMSYGFGVYLAGKQAAHLAAQIFQGIPPSDLPVELSEFILTINMDTATKLQVNIPDHLMRLAKVVRKQSE